ncbi:autophagy-related protein 18h-like isoform X2 [Nymphaea colorata]|uniref:autophagy-related protein 18h-like isoform X2 n=1 Tax=Nymphaea colorata TaxID=210225 RepID=UPI00129D838E|nr:autophagy-related protein 18h-like isoform X2 [Nymphaea colorata]
MKKDGKSARNGSGGRLLPNSIRIISSCLKTVSSNANSVASTVRSAGASVASSISFRDEEQLQKDQVQWAGFDKLEVGPSAFKHVLLLGYSNGFQVVDVEDASNVRELVSKRDGPVTFLQMQPLPSKLEDEGGFRASHPLLLVVAGEANSNALIQSSNFGGKLREGITHPQETNTSSSTVVRFYSLKSHNYVHVLRFRSVVYLVRCSPRIIAIALATQIYCFDPVTLENKFSVLTYPVPLMGQGVTGVNIGYGPMAVGPRWLSYASNQSLISNTGRLSPQNLTPSPGSSPSNSPGNGSLMARLAMESSKHLAAGLINIGDMGYKTLSKYCQDMLPDGSSSPVPSNGSWKVGRVTSSTHSTENDNVGVVVVKDFITKATIAQFRAHTSPISALCFDPSGTLLVTASVNGNNINVFRIMPLHVTDDPNSVCYDWSASHVHLYKLHRGMTSAVIQDICFSSYSQWVAIISSRGTCHIFVLSPFGGEVSLCSHAYFDGSAPFLDSPSAWWLSSGSCALNMHNGLQLPPPPPPPPPIVTLSVVSRIKNSNGGWLNTVSGSAVKRNAPSGALSAVFHNSVSRVHQSGPLKSNCLEYLLVCSPSGHVVQHDLLPAFSTATDLHYSNISPRIGAGPSGSNLDEDFKVISEPVQWWDVCRRTNWPEREGSLSSIGFDEIESNGASTDCFDCDGMQVSCFNALSNEVDGKERHKSNENLHWYLSNAEVQINSGRIPVWQTSKICFFAMSNQTDDHNCSGGEIEIEKVHVQEIEMREKDLLPVFDHYHSFQSDQSIRRDTKGRYANASSHEVVNGQSAGMKSPIVLPSTEIPIYIKSLHASSQMSQMANQNESLIERKGEEASEQDRERNAKMTSSITNLFSENRSPSIGDEVTRDGLLICGGDSCNGKSDISCLNVHLHPMSESPEATAPVDIINYFGGHCKVSEVDGCYRSGETAGDSENSNSRDTVSKKNNVVDHDDMLEGVFAFS